MKTLFLSTLFFFLLSSFLAIAQEDTTAVVLKPDFGIIQPPDHGVNVQLEPAPVYQVVEQMPEFPGGQAALMDYLKKNLRYPEIARESEVQGRVIVRFVVNEDGKISDVVILRDIGAGCSQEAKRVVSSMPKWAPGRQNGKVVKTYFTLPVTFRLN